MRCTPRSPSWPMPRTAWVTATRHWGRNGMRPRSGSWMTTPRTLTCTSGRWNAPGLVTETAMTEQRAHWRDDLIEAVFRIMDGYALEEYRGDRRHGTPTYDIIAAVEDWIDARGSAIDGREVVAAIAAIARVRERAGGPTPADRKSTRLNSSHITISYAVFC